ncbi:MAG TPA: hypothetical protein VGO78_14985, partial [Acidimicrobiales bacterium]|nr:hypothetical protein [Acidimicrobiales bacterium]
VPAGTRPDGLPGSLSLIGPAGTDRRLAAVAQGVDPAAPAADTEVELAVVGAHLRGLPLHHQLGDRGARFVRACRTASMYRLHVLDTEPPKPGMVRVGPDQGGGPVEAEVWALDVAAFGSFVAEVPPPLTIGTVELEDGTRVKGFLCEPAALDGAEDITATGSWRIWWDAGTETGPASCPPPPAESDLGG